MGDQPAGPAAAAAAAASTQVTTLKSLVEAGSEDTPIAWTELHRRAEAGDTASKKAIAELEKQPGSMPPPIEGVEGLTLPGIADALLSELGSAVLFYRLDGRDNEDHLNEIGVDYGTAIEHVRALATAFRDIDAVLARVRADEPAALAPTLEAFLTAAWDESQKAGVAIDVADQVVGKLRLRLAANG